MWNLARFYEIVTAFAMINLIYENTPVGLHLSVTVLVIV